MIYLYLFSLYFFPHSIGKYLSVTSLLLCMIRHYLNNYYCVMIKILRIHMFSMKISFYRLLWWDRWVQIQETLPWHLLWRRSFSKGGGWKTGRDSEARQYHPRATCYQRKAAERRKEGRPIFILFCFPWCLCCVCCATEACAKTSQENLTWVGRTGIISHFFLLFRCGIGTFFVPYQ